MSIKNNLNKQLKPLYFVSFFQGLIFWYSIEKIFMSHIGFSPSTITASVVILNLVTLVSEIPSGILADRWSRKGTLVISMIFLTLAAVVFGVSNIVPTYLFGIMLFAFYAATYSGLMDSIIYDTVLELEGSGRKFSSYFGRSKLYTSTAWVIGSLLGALIAQKYGLRAAFLYSIPCCVLALFAAISVLEPSIHKMTDGQTKLINHVKQTIHYLSQQEGSFLVVLCVITTSIPLAFLMEVDQLWPMALMLPIVWYGPLNALLLSGSGLGAVLAQKLKSSTQLLLLSCLGIISVALLSFRHLESTVIGQFTTITIFTILNVIVTAKLHDSVPSRIRTGVSSAVSTASTLATLPLLLVFGMLVNNYSVFTASYLLVAISLLVFSLFIRLTLSERSAR